MAAWVGWLALAGIVVICELFTGTFYLLMISLGLLAGGIAALSGLNLEFQFIAAAMVGIAATYGLRKSRFGKLHRGGSGHDPNMNLDIGQTLSVQEWRSNGDEPGTARVMYRGAMWDTQLAQGAIAQPGVFVIKEIRGSCLIVANHHSVVN